MQLVFLQVSGRAGQRSPEQEIRISNHSLMLEHTYNQVNLSFSVTLVGTTTNCNIMHKAKVVLRLD